jgi:hypothetical protein
MIVVDVDCIVCCRLSVVCCRLSVVGCLLIVERLTKTDNLSIFRVI